MWYELSYSNGAVSTKFFRPSPPRRGGRDSSALSLSLTMCPPVMEGMKWCRMTSSNVVGSFPSLESSSESTSTCAGIRWYSTRMLLEAVLSRFGREMTPHSPIFQWCHECTSPCTPHHQSPHRDVVRLPQLSGFRFLRRFVLLRPASPVLRLTTTWLVVDSIRTLVQFR